jgi:hypothetical protein
MMAEGPGKASTNRSAPQAALSNINCVPSPLPAKYALNPGNDDSRACQVAAGGFWCVHTLLWLYSASCPPQPHANAAGSCAGAVLGGLSGRLQDFISRLQERVMFSFLPRKEDVTDDYWEWLKWRLGQVCQLQCPGACMSHCRLPDKHQLLPVLQATVMSESLK